MANIKDLKFGDRVILTRKFGLAAQVGATGTVTGIHSWNNLVGIKWDRDGRDFGQHDGSYNPQDFEKMEDNTTKAEFIIALKKDGAYLPAVKPRTYSSEAQANAVAESMSAKHGGEFVVFKTTASFELPPAPKVKKKVYA